MRAAPSNDGNGQAARRRRPILRGGSRSHYSHINIVIVADHDDHLPLNVCTHPDDIGDDDLRLECRVVRIPNTGLVHRGCTKSIVR